ncbi:hybrid sensor histidine kinase/response regulator [Pseudomonas sp. MIL19]|uniref:hybrid sensor histidine kinase/response regulator n=1 Tax=Pseudomonas sp. MIL19 TaxID=2976979 RepID=UPI0023637A54|nr:hybrid sensor histidine kinase/response regulator [Pseudomonas sp. MIL19]MDD2159736.1 hybrid sensor histidine kinase/response regulator [Pseudomonas sp. MIL19]
MTPGQMRDASLLELYRMEADAQAQVLDAGLLILEREPNHAGQLEACMRAAHSLKGAARIVGLDDGVKVAHAMEDLLVAAQEGLLRLLPEQIDGLLQGTDLLRRVGAQDAADAPSAERIEQLVALLERQLATAVPALGRGTAAEPVLPQTTLAPQVAAQEPAEELPDEGRGRVLRVSAERLDHLLDMSGKALVEFQRIQPLTDSLQRLKRQQTAVRRALDGLRDLTLNSSLEPQAQALLDESRAQLAECQQLLQTHFEAFDEFSWEGGLRSRSLYDAALSSRMRPLADVLVGRARMVRDLGRSLGKQVRLDIEGDATQVDRDVLERLDAPLTHLLRNALDHGIELPELRVRKGKAEEGRLLLRARHRAGMLVLELSDDGAGVDVEHLREVVVTRKFASAETAARLSEDELLAFLFLPGFSLREQVSEMSGRGVGLDAVQHALRQLRGSVRLEARRGEGSTFILQVPLALSVVRSLVVDIAGEAYAFPLAHIEHMLRVSVEDVVQLEGRQHFWHGDRHVSLIAASQLLQRPEGRCEEVGIALVLIRERDNLYGIAVDRFIGERTLVVMPLDARLGKVRDVSAGALLDDGTPVLILDVEDLFSSIGKLLGSGHLERVDRRSQGVQEAARKRVLVVDDSLTVRELERKLLLSRGYEVAVAVDGMDGWNALRDEHFDLLITDIDMPRMDGIELVTLLRRDSRLRTLPVMVVSYKDREEDRRRGLDAGADYYLAKASFHDEALLDAVQVLIGEAQG